MSEVPEEALFDEALVDLFTTVGMALVSTGQAIRLDSVANEERARDAWAKAGVAVVDILQLRGSAPWRIR